MAAKKFQKSSQVEEKKAQNEKPAVEGQGGQEESQGVQENPGARGESEKGQQSDHPLHWGYLILTLTKERDWGGRGR